MFGLFELATFRKRGRDESRDEKGRSPKREHVEGPGLGDGLTRNPAPSGPEIKASSWSDFVQHRVIGVGGYGAVTLATHKATGEVVAVKELSKAAVLESDRLPQVLAERQLLEVVRGSTFLTELRCSFQDDRSVYLVLDFVPGGDLFRLLQDQGTLTEAEARFYAAEVVLALERLHSHHIAYRDLKPENILLNTEGHVVLADLGLAKVIPPNVRSFTVCGTPEYSAPEVVINDGHGTAVDMWSLGCLIYDMIMGQTPFHDDDVSGVYQRILEGAAEPPPGSSAALRDLLPRLLEPDMEARMTDFAQLRAHPWFADINWALLEQRAVPAPFPPALAGPLDSSRFDDVTDAAEERIAQWEALDSLNPQQHALFSDF